MSNIKHSYPYEGWVLTPSLAPKKVTFIQQYQSYGTVTWVVAASGKFYRDSEIHATKRDAVAAGWARHDEQCAKLEKMQASLAKKKAALQKATASLSEES